MKFSLLTTEGLEGNGDEQTPFRWLWGQERQNHGYYPRVTSSAERARSLKHANGGTHVVGDSCAQRQKDIMHSRR